MGKWEAGKKSTEKARQSVVSQKFLCAARGCPPEVGGDRWRSSDVLYGHAGAPGI